MQKTNQINEENPCLFCNVTNCEYYDEYSTTDTENMSVKCGNYHEKGTPYPSIPYDELI